MQMQHKLVVRGVRSWAREDLGYEAYRLVPRFNQDMLSACPFFEGS
jgi:hypothetical protein